MINLLFDSIFNQAVSFFGSPLIVAVITILFFLGLAMLLGLPFDFALLLTAPIPYAMYSVEWIPIWFAGILIVIILGFSVYLIWTRFQNKV